jgi:hypothetical protein
VFGGTCCHYCDRPATTRDHIVPQCVPRVSVTGESPRNIVPACTWCNENKSGAPSNCYCDICFAAKLAYAPLWWLALPEIDPSALSVPARVARSLTQRVAQRGEVQWCFRCDRHHYVGAHSLPRPSRWS